MGKGKAQFRKAQNMTQTQFANALGIAQQAMAYYKGSKSRIPVALQSTLATLLVASVKEVIGKPVKVAEGKSDPTPRLQRQMDVIGLLPRAKQKLVM
ncbi:hypothetical protein [Microbulbifer discodermiae]|uniref:hypothetical protein n=1 Tax=Microbulbifer sp. 2201CG32-9 TaxID=3232309 RepID=UPI00345BB2C0